MMLDRDFFRPELGKDGTSKLLFLLGLELGKDVAPKLLFLFEVILQASYIAILSYSYILHGTHGISFILSHMHNHVAI